MEPSSISYPFRRLFRKYKNARFRMATLQEVVPSENKIILSNGELQYDILVMATGAESNFFGNKNVEEKAMPMKTVGDALMLRNLVYTRLERATRTQDKELRRKLLTFAIAGADTWTLNGYHQLALATSTGGGKEANDYLRFSKPNAIKSSDSVLKDDFRLLDLFRKKGAMQTNWQGAGYTDVVGAFARGDALMTPNGSWAITAINAQDPKFNVGTFPFPGKQKGQSLTIGAGDLAWSISSSSKHKKEANAFVEYMSRPEVMQKYYDVDGSPTAIEGVKEAGSDAPLAGLAELAFTDWTSESDFYTLTGNYITTGNKEDMTKALNAFFNPMKADVE